MQFLYVIVLVAILIGGYQYFTWDKSETNNPEATTEVPSETEREPEIVSNETEATDTEADSTTIETDTEIDAEINVLGSETKVFEIGGTNFAFDVTEMKVKEGDTVTINFVSNDGFHDWVVDEFDAATDQVRPGTPTSVTFVADKAGTYQYYCSVGQHRANGMVGTLIVE